MRRMHLSVFGVVGLALALAVTGCGGSSGGVTGPDEAAPAASGAAVVDGTVVGGSFAAASTGGVTSLSGTSGMTVRVEGTSITSFVDEEGKFILSGLPAGSVTLIFEGNGATARLTVSGLLDGQVLSLEVHVSGGTATLTTPAHCTPTTNTKIIGAIESVGDNQLVVDGHRVDTSQVVKVWRGSRRIELGGLKVGEKVKVWGTLKGDGVLVAEEIKALGEGEKQWVSFSGRVQSVGFRAQNVHGNPNTPSYPTLVVAGRKVKTDGGTKFKWSDGTALDPGSIKVGDRAYVEGWDKPQGYVQASKVKVDCR